MALAVSKNRGETKSLRSHFHRGAHKPCPQAASHSPRNFPSQRQAPPPAKFPRHARRLQKRHRRSARLCRLCGKKRHWEKAPDIPDTPDTEDGGTIEKVWNMATYVAAFEQRVKGLPLRPPAATA